MDLAQKDMLLALLPPFSNTKICLHKFLYKLFPALQAAEILEFISGDATTLPAHLEEIIHLEQKGQHLDKDSKSETKKELANEDEEGRVVFA
jgi:hypothetical protein